MAYAAGSGTAIEVDVIILGGGLAGHSAALAAAESGAEVLLIEKQAAVGGSTVLSGGFSRSEELLRTFAPAQVRALCIGGAGNTGDGLRMAWGLGADFRDIGHVKGTFGTHPTTRPDRHEILLAYYTSGPRG